MNFKGKIGLIEIMYNEDNEVTGGYTLGVFENWTRKQLLQFIEDTIGEKLDIEQEAERGIFLKTDSGRKFILINADKMIEDIGEDAERLLNEKL
jgi:hypothetical protein